jgi:hypothetical protein
MAHKTRGYIQYTPSFPGWTAMSIKVDDTTATNNGATLASAPPVNNFWPARGGDLRAVYGKDSTGARDHCTAVDPAGTLYALASTFVDNEGNSYTTTALRAEHIRMRDLK